MNKVGLITFHYAHHYGAQLQAYALMRAIEALGYDCEIINYVRPDTIQGNNLFKKGLSPRAILSNLHTSLHYSSIKQRFDRFTAFAQKDMKLSKSSYSTYEDIEAKPPEYDTYICGSDQVWNPLIFASRDFDPAFFMPFAGDKKRIAYAPSFGISSIPDNKKEQLKDYLASFSHLSVRENQGEKIIEELTPKKAVTVLDPTLLLGETEWSKISNKPDFNKEYLLCYFVSDPTPYFPYIKAISKATKLPIVTLCGSRKSIPGSIHSVFDAGPREFLGLFKHASFICTNSFHGTVFSVNYKKNFLSFTAASVSEKALNSRQHSILSALELQNRIVTPNMSLEQIEKLASKASDIDYGNVEKHLAVQKQKSLEYLSSSLSSKDESLNNKKFIVTNK